ncbi:ABC transporter permease subunit [Kutzneria sp. NPDC052558]|uniref:ABC transporter permease subunit n=1 Tax=Kutzneria sp. NPDC052558 TaxID=3364121 RepID=UPI0037C8B70F
MMWLTWRQSRVPGLSVLAGLLVVAAVLAVTGPQLVGRTDYSDLDVLYMGTIIAMYLLPAVLGVFWGVPMITRELETGTHSLVWNQTVTRRRWLATKGGIGVLAATITAGALSAAITWWAEPIDSLVSTLTNSSMPSHMSPIVFAARGIAPIGYAAFAYVLGVAVGLVVRRTVAAMAVTLVLFAAVMVAVPLFVRPYVLPAVRETVSITEANVTGIVGNDQTGIIQSIKVREPAGVWVLTNETVDPSGKAVSPLPDFVQTCMPKPDRQSGPPDQRIIATCLAELQGRGYRQVLSYQPDSRFWPLQWLETAFFLALSTLLGWFCFRRLRHVS